MEEPLDERVRRLEAQAANDHSIIRDLHEQGKKFYGALVAMQNAVDGLLTLIDPTHKPEPPSRRDLM
jgi:hypothetical protein